MKRFILLLLFGFYMTTVLFGDNRIRKVTLYRFMEGKILYTTEYFFSYDENSQIVSSARTVTTYYDGQKTDDILYMSDGKTVSVSFRRNGKVSNEAKQSMTLDSDGNVIGNTYTSKMGNGDILKTLNNVTYLEFDGVRTLEMIGNTNILYHRNKIVEKRGDESIFFCYENNDFVKKVYCDTLNNGKIIFGSGYERFTNIDKRINSNYEWNNKVNLPFICLSSEMSLPPFMEMPIIAGWIPFTIRFLPCYEDRDVTTQFVTDEEDRIVKMTEYKKLIKGFEMLRVIKVEYKN